MVERFGVRPVLGVWHLAGIAKRDRLGVKRGPASSPGETSAGHIVEGLTHGVIRRRHGGRASREEIVEHAAGLVRLAVAAVAVRAKQAGETVCHHLRDFIKAFDAGRVAATESRVTAGQQRPTVLHGVQLARLLEHVAHLANVLPLLPPDVRMSREEIALWHSGLACFPCPLLSLADPRRGLVRHLLRELAFVAASPQPHLLLDTLDVLFLHAVQQVGYLPDGGRRRPIGLDALDCLPGVGCCRSLRPGWSVLCFGPRRALGALACAVVGAVAAACRIALLPELLEAGLAAHHAQQIGRTWPPWLAGLHGLLARWQEHVAVVGRFLPSVIPIGFLLRQAQPDVLQRLVGSRPRLQRRITDRAPRHRCRGDVGGFVECVPGGHHLAADHVPQRRGEHPLE